ncbi:uncharacterized protein TRIVIDRAFT_63586 [Trichoderma virens Gv29-8]|uniref:Uncharacterized protein n=1 Tax=Hypocrea virens (strain Gv29-8 / FGSC 10586) TaxID=413071 RepID=G9MHS5_HYPVG|nr:uncharacterized protein TRIVIDRAFT_63586 [Trichoderma virens Gv29-8]EHK26713.1 hypothetical protein TRIVIDRAFT_63586 [Trichoderma virens Gv29-8]
MKYNTTAFFAAAAALVSITSASASAAECNQTASGEPGEPGICAILPATPPELPSVDPLDDVPPCIEVIFREDQCSIDPYTPPWPLPAAAAANLTKVAECKCSGTTFANWLECQSCLVEHDLYNDVNYIWYNILTGVKAVLCNAPEHPYGVPEFVSPAQTYIPIPTTTPMASIIPIAPSTTDEPSEPITQASLAIDHSVAVTALGPQKSCDEVPQDFSKQQDTIITGPTITGITLTASFTNQSFSAAATPTEPPRKPVVHLPPATETSNAVSSFEKLGLTLAIVGGLVLGML